MRMYGESIGSNYLASRSGRSPFVVMCDGFNVLAWMLDWFRDETGQFDPSAFRQL